MINTALPRIGDGQMQRLIQLIEDALTALEAHPLAGLVILRDVAVSSAGVRVYHGLGQQARGAWIVRAVVDVRIAVSATPDLTDPANYFTISSSTAATVDLAVF